MTISTLLLFGAFGCALRSCQPPAPAAQTPPPVAAAGGAPTPAAARAAVDRYLQAQPNAALFVPDSARVNDNDATWQVLVPRTDWARRRPSAARFEVNKNTGAVSTAPVK